MKELRLDEIQDEATRENFRALRDLLKEFPLYRGQFQFFELNLAADSYPKSFTRQHHLGFLPKDVLQTSAIGAATITWDYANFTTTEIAYTISGPIVVRAFIGRYEEGSRA